MTSPFSARTRADQANLLPGGAYRRNELKGGALDFGKSARVKPVVFLKPSDFTQNEIGGKSKKSECQQENSEG
jgi:hypothetical protein